jgi:uncharacterized protein (DUF736 family)
MTEIGRLKPANTDSLATMAGYVQTLDSRLALRLTGDETRCDSKTPSHRIYARTRMGTEVEVGAAWLKTAKAGPRAGERFLTLSIDYPGLASALNVAAFSDQASGEWIVLWRRRAGHGAEALSA